MHDIGFFASIQYAKLIWLIVDTDTDIYVWFLFLHT